MNSVHTGDTMSRREVLRRAELPGFKTFPALKTQNITILENRPGSYPWIELWKAPQHAKKNDPEMVMTLILYDIATNWNWEWGRETIMFNP